MFLLLLLASIIPVYQISTLTDEGVTFSNNSFFSFIRPFPFSSWEVGDEIEILSNSDPFSQPPVQFSAGEFSIIPGFIFRNRTRGDSEHAVYLVTPPDNVSGATFLISSIDSNARTVTLSDNSVWRYRSHEVNMWQVNDYILIGKNAVPVGYDAILFNATRQSIARALEE